MAPMYVPAHKAGGPVPGIRGVVESLGGHEVRVLTSDRDLGDLHPFPPPYRGTTKIGDSVVTYLPPPARASLKAWTEGFRAMRGSDLVYLNSLMSKGFTVVPLLLLWASRYRGRVVISPRGELAGSALRLGGSRQKRLWIRILRTLRLDTRLRGRRVVWVASSDGERDAVLQTFPDAEVVVVPERLRSPGGARTRTSVSMSRGLQVVAVGRLAPVKGHDDLLRGLAKVQVPVELWLLGLEEDPAHAAVLRDLATALPAHVRVHFQGAVTPEEVESRLRAAHLFALLSHGENFGHAIGEALRAGCPLLISDQTPWSGTAEAGAGVVLDPVACRSPEAVAGAIESFARLSDDEWQTWSTRAEAFVVEQAPATTLLEALDAAAPGGQA